MLIDNFFSLQTFDFRKTFFDYIDEHIRYPSLFEMGIYSLIDAVSVADEKIIITAERVNFNLFSLEEERWSKSVVMLRESGDILDWIESVQLFTVRNLKSDG